MLSDITYQNSFFSKNKAINERADHKLITQGNLMFVHELLLKTIKRLNNFLIFSKYLHVITISIMTETIPTETSK